MKKPAYVSEIKQKIRPAMRIISLSGKRDPGLIFDGKITKILSWLDNKEIAHNFPTLGIYYLHRDSVGVENVTWDACVPVVNKIQVEDDFKYQELYKTEVVSVVLTGGYNLISPALNWMESEAKNKGIKIEWPLTEIYLKEGDKPLTELQYFVVKK